MKNAIFTLLLVALCFMAFSQKSYLDNNPEWYVFSSCGVPAPCIAEDTYNLRLGNDTLVNGLLYKQIEGNHYIQKRWLSATERDPRCDTDNPSFEKNIEGLIRQQGEKLFVFINNEEQLLYDFSLQVGDTIPESYITRQTSETLVIDSIGIVVYNGDSLKKFILNDGFFTLIEGIGSNYGLLNPIGSILECGHNLNCYKNSGKQALNFNGGEACNFAVSVNEIDNMSLKLYPNPASNYLLVESVQGSLGSIEVYNLYGKKLKVESKNLSEKSIRMNLNYLNTGVYFIKDANSAITYRVMKQ